MPYLKSWDSDKDKDKDKHKHKHKHNNSMINHTVMTENDHDDAMNKSKHYVYCWWARVMM